VEGLTVLANGRGKPYTGDVVPPRSSARPLGPLQHPLGEDDEDRLDAEEARAALAEFRASGERSIPIDDVLAEDGLTRADLSE
jgi:hypothetical protein